MCPTQYFLCTNLTAQYELHIHIFQAPEQGEVFMEASEVCFKDLVE